MYNEPTPEAGESGGIGRRAGFRRQWGNFPVGVRISPFAPSWNMQLKIVTHPGSLAHSLHFSLPPERYQQARQNRLRTLVQSRRLPGYRRGHAPLALLEKRYGAELHEDALHETVRHCLVQALEQHKLRPAHTPRISASRTAEDGSVQFTADFEVLPEVHLRPLQELQVERADCEINTDEVDRQLEQFRTRRMQLIPVQRCATLQDWVEVLPEAPQAEAGNADTEQQGTHLDLGSPTLPWHIKSALNGALPGDRVDIKPTAGSTDQPAPPFAVRVARVLRADLPELSDEYIAGLGIKDVQNLAQLRTRIRREITPQGEQLARRITHRSVMAALRDAYTFAVPDCMVQQELQERQDNAAAGAAEPQREEAVQAVRLRLLLSELIRELKLQPERALVQQLQEYTIATAPDPVAQRKACRTDPAWQGRFRAMALESQLVDAVLKQAAGQRRTFGYLRLQELHQHPDGLRSLADTGTATGTAAASSPRELENSGREG